MELRYGTERILILAPHADDEVLGCGGLMARARALGNDVKVVLATTGDTEYLDGRIVTQEDRVREMNQALATLTIPETEVLVPGRDSELDMVPLSDIVTAIDRVLREWKPTVVLFPYPSFHQDHQRLYDACLAALRPRLDGSWHTAALYEYPNIVWQPNGLPSSGELYVQLDDEALAKKVLALEEHASQMLYGKYTITPEAVRQWAMFRGFEIGATYAEKFYLLRQVIS